MFIHDHLWYCHKKNDVNTKNRLITCVLCTCETQGRTSDPLWPRNEDPFVLTVKRPLDLWSVLDVSDVLWALVILHPWFQWKERPSFCSLLLSFPLKLLLVFECDHFQFQSDFVVLMGTCVPPDGVYFFKLGQSLAKTIVNNNNCAKKSSSYHTNHTDPVS